MKINIFGLKYCFHHWVTEYNRYDVKIRRCVDCQKTQIQLFNYNKKKFYWVGDYVNTKS